MRDNKGTAVVKRHERKVAVAMSFENRRKWKIQIHAKIKTNLRRKI